MSQGLRRFHVGDRLSEMTIHNGTVDTSSATSPLGTHCSDQTTPPLPQ